MRFYIFIFSIFFAKIAVCQQNTNLKFAFISDTHIGGTSTASEDLERTVQDINAMADLQFVLISGDITEFGADRELQEAKRIFDQLKIKWYIIPGNHDTKWSESGCNSFRQIFGYERFVFDIGGYKFVGCSSGPNMRMAPGLVPRQDVVWLDSIVTSIEKARQPLIFVNHYPMDSQMANWYKILDILKRANTQAILCGHGHRNKALDFEGIPGTMGRSNLRAKEAVGGYNIVTIAKDSMYFQERTPLQKTNAVWQNFVLQSIDFKQDTNNYERPSFAVNTQFPNVKVVWSLQDSSDIGAGIVCQKNACIYTNANGYVTALNQANGQVLWRFQAKGKIFSTPAIQDNKVVFASTDSTIYCVNFKTGKPIWQVKTAKAIVASPIIEKNKLYIGSSEGKFWALNLKTGAQIWEFKDVEGFVETTPAIDAAHIYFGSWGTYFYALDKKTGKLAWKWHNGSASRLYSPAACFPRVANGRVFIVAPDRIVTALDAKTGKQIWRSTANKGRESIALSADQSLIYVKSMWDTLSAISTQTPDFQVKWSIPCGYVYDISPSPSVEKDGMLFLPTDKGEIYAIDTKTQTVRWVHKLSNALINNVFPLGNQEIVTTTMDGGVFRLKFE